MLAHKEPGVNQPAKLDGEKAPVQQQMQQQPTRLLELLQSYLSSGADLRKEANCQHAADDKSAQP